MINLKTTRELRYMRDAGKISQEALLKAGEAVRPGVSTLELDKIVRRTIEKAGAVPSFLGYGGFPASACISVNNVVIHGIPSAHEILKEGDIVSIDVGAIYEGFNGDNAWTFPCGKVSEEAQKLMDATRESLFLAIEKAVPGNRIGDIGSAVQQYVEARNYSVVREFLTLYRRTRRASATVWYALSSAMASARRCTRSRKYRTSENPEGDRD